MKTNHFMSNNPAEMCGATSGEHACTQQVHGGAHTCACGHTW